MPSELEAQELSAIDSARGLYYILGLNKTSGGPNLVSIDVSTGKISKSKPVPFTSSVFVGVGQNLDVDPIDGTIILMGHDPAHDNHHCVYTGELPRGSNSGPSPLPPPASSDSPTTAGVLLRACAADPETFEVTYVADLGGTLTMDLLGTYTFFDSDEKEVRCSCGGRDRV